MKLSNTLAISLLAILLCGSIGIAAAQDASLNSVTSPTTTNLNAVCVVNNATNGGSNDLTQLNAWAVGDGGTIVFWDGMSWTTVTSPTSANLYSVAFSDVNNGWAVGGSGDTGVILYYNGTWSEWELISFGTDANAHDVINSTLYAVTLAPDGMTGWVVGADGIALGLGDGTWYGMTNAADSTLRGVAMMHGSDDAWAVGDGGTIVQWNGQNWSPMTSNTIAPLYTITILNDTAAFAAGGTGSEGTVLMLQDGTWSQYTNFQFDMGGTTTSTLNSTIYSMSFANATAGWAVGSNGMVMYWSGDVWECNDQVADVDLNGVSIVHSSDGSIQAWAVGDSGTILAFNGTNWVPELPIVAIPVLLGIGLIAALLGKLKLFKRPLAVSC
ncbi:MAG: hypothetical protein ACQCN6_00560 [Candidatus Bathyarchaeia archaeon]|jgi:hypothetical protein